MLFVEAQIGTSDGGDLRDLSTQNVDFSVPQTLDLRTGKAFSDLHIH